MRTLRLVLLILLTPIWLPFYVMVMGLGMTMGQPMVWPAMLMQMRYRPRKEPEP